MAAGSEAGSCVRAARADSEPKLSRPTRPLRDAPRPRSSLSQLARNLRDSPASLGTCGRKPPVIGRRWAPRPRTQPMRDRDAASRGLTPPEPLSLANPWAEMRTCGCASLLARCFLHVPFSSSPLLETVFRDLKKLFLIWELETEQAC